MSKVYFIGGGFQGCWYVRCFLPIMANKWRGNYTGLSRSSLKSPQRVFKEIQDADVVVFHRANTVEHHKMAIELKKLGKKIVFDNDDTFVIDKDDPFYNFDEKGKLINTEGRNNLINNFILNSDLVTASTPVLAEEYAKINPNVVVLPNCVNPSDWPKPLKNETDKVRIGLVGSVAYHQDFEVIKDLLKRLDKSDKVQLVLFGLWDGKKRAANPLVEKLHQKEFKFWDSIKNKEQAPWCEMSDYFYTLNKLRLDMMLIPRKENYFNTCKSNIKFMEAAMLEIPVIASGFKNGPYQELDGENGILIEDGKWEEAIWSLVDNPGKRLMIGATANKYVKDNYDINKHAHLWAEQYEKLCVK